MSATIQVRARVENRNGEFLVTAYVDPSVCDRHDFVDAWFLGNAKLAARLVRAIEAGKALRVVGVSTDCGGRTYLSTESQVLARMMNADLKRLGF
jgi:hypothetical protein